MTFAIQRLSWKRLAAISLASVLVLCAAAPAARAEEEKSATGGAGSGTSAASPLASPFTFGLAVGVANCFNSYLGGHASLDFGFRINPRAHFALVPTFSGGHDIGRGLGVFNWTVTGGYRRFVGLKDKYATVLLGPTAGYWINSDNGEWIVIGATVQTALMWRKKLDVGIYAGLTLTHGFSQNEDVPSEFNGRIQFGVKLNF